MAVFVKNTGQIWTKAGGGAWTTISGIQPLVITTSSPLVPGTIGIPYAASLAANGGVAPYTWSFVSSTGSNTWVVTSFGSLTGTPASVETDTVTVRVTDSLSTTTTKTFSITVAANSSASYWPNGDIIAASGAYTDVLAAVNTATDGMRVLIPPGGPFVWTQGIKTTKQIFVGAQSLNSVFQGRTNQGVIISNQTVPVSGGGTATSACLSFTSGNTYHCGTAGIYWATPLVGSDACYGNIYVTGTGSKVMLVWDSAFECNSIGTGAIDAQRINFHSVGGLLWNCYFMPTPGGTWGDTVGPQADIVIGAYPFGQISWQSNSTMGVLDTTGTNNVYVEASTFVYASNQGTIDSDKTGRVVLRYCNIQGCGFTGHGFTSNNLGYNGNRHFEIYNNAFSIPNANRNLGGPFFWTRMGTGVVYNNTFTDQPGNNYNPSPGTIGESNPSQHGAPYFDANGAPLLTDQYPIPSQPGQGWFNGAAVSDPLYMWNNVYGTKMNHGNQPWGINSSWSLPTIDLLAYGRDLMDEFHGLGGGTANLPKPSGAWNGNAGPYAGYNYPHPARLPIDLFSVKPSANSRYLTKQDGTPFPDLGRAAWAIIGLNYTDQQTFIADTVAKQFTAIEIYAPAHDPRAVNSPKDGFGNLPFLKNLSGAAWNGAINSASNVPDFTTPNPAYWTNVDNLVALCAANGILIHWFPAYDGFSGAAGDQGWRFEKNYNGTARMLSYGQFVANRYANYGNIVWMLAGDYGSGSFPYVTNAQPGGNTNEATVELNLYNGLNSVAGKLFSSEDNTESISTDMTTIGGTVISYNGAYSFQGSTATQGRRAYNYSPVLPAFLDEEPYDQEGPDGNNVNGSATQPVRRFIYWGLLSSIGGYTAGNGYVWPFGSGAWNLPTHLNSQGAQDLARLNTFWKSIQWWRLVPSGLNSMITLVTGNAGNIDTQNYVAASCTALGDLMVVYFSPAQSGAVTFNMTAMRGAWTSTWINPANGATTVGPSGTNSAGTAITSPGGNGDGLGSTDWVLKVVA